MLAWRLFHQYQKVYLIKEYEMHHSFHRCCGPKTFWLIHNMNQNVNKIFWKYFLDKENYF